MAKALEKYLKKYGLVRVTAWLRAAADRYEALRTGNPGKKRAQHESRELNAQLGEFTEHDLFRLREILKRGEK